MKPDLVDSHMRRNFLSRFTTDQYRVNLRIILFTSIILMMLVGYSRSFGFGITYPTTDNMYYSTLGTQLQNSQRFETVARAEVAKLTGSEASLTNSEWETQSRALVIFEERWTDAFGPRSYLSTALIACAVGSIFGSSVLETEYATQKTIVYNLTLALGLIIPTLVLVITLTAVSGIRAPLALLMCLLSYALHQFSETYSQIIRAVTWSVWPRQSYNYEFWFFGFSPRFLVLPLVLAALLAFVSGRRHVVFLILGFSAYFHLGNALAAILIFALSEILLNVGTSLLSYQWWLPYLYPSLTVASLIQPYRLVSASVFVTSMFLVFMALTRFRTIENVANRTRLGSPRILGVFFFIGHVFSSISVFFESGTSEFALARAFENRVVMIHQPIVGTLLMFFLLELARRVVLPIRGLLTIFSAVLFSLLSLGSGTLLFKLGGEVTSQASRNASLIREFEDMPSSSVRSQFFETPWESYVYFLTERKLLYKRNSSTET